MLCLVCCQVTVMALLTAWFRQVREEQGQATLPDKSDLLEALQRLPISFGMARRTHDTVKQVGHPRSLSHCG
jgi:glucosamine--fructose-6-phosphate aminotransferase (isomerizing)